MTFFQDLANWVAQIEQVENDLGVPTRKPVAIRKSVLRQGEIIPELKDYFLKPVTEVKSIPPKLINYQLSEGTIVLSADDLYIELPRIYSEEFLSQDIEFYVISPKRNNQGKLYKGDRCQFLYLIDEDPVYWGVVVRNLQDREPIQVI